MNIVAVTGRWWLAAGSGRFWRGAGGVAARPTIAAGQPGPVVVAVPLGTFARGVALPGPAGQADGDRTGLAGARSGDHPVAGGHRQHIADPAAFQVSAQVRVRAVYLIAVDPGGRGPRVHRTGDHAAGQLRLGGERRPLRDACCGAPGGVRDPGPGQVQLTLVPRQSGNRHAVVMPYVGTGHRLKRRISARLAFLVLRELAKLCPRYSSYRGSRRIVIYSGEFAM
jgi:hypothetical protein